MTVRTARIRKYMVYFQKICNFLKNSDFIKKKIGKKLIFFLEIFQIFYGTIGCVTKFHALKYNFILSIFVRSNAIAFFCEKIAKVEDTICDCNCKT